MSDGVRGFVEARELGPKRSADVCVIGSGAGGAVVAAELAAAGLDVLVLEEGGRYTKADFKMREDLAMPALYQDAGTRSTKDLGIALLQGRAVGGSTVVNWTTCFRTPEVILDRWRTRHAVSGLGRRELDPHWDAIEARLNILQLPLDETNRNNRLLYEGCRALGLEAETVSRNTRACFKSGYCGMGCPVDAKQSMNVTYLPDAVASGATVASRCRVDRLRIAGGRAVAAECTALDRDGRTALGPVEISARRFVLAAGGIGTPGILLRSGLGDGVVGRRTFLHPVVAVSARYADDVNPFYGAPQSVASHAHADRGPDVGYFLEAAPLHPMLAAMALSGMGEDHRQAIAELPRLAAHIALLIDGHHDDVPGGTVELRPSGSPVLDYPIPPRLWEAAKAALRTLVRVNLAAGAEWVRSGHDPAVVIRSERELGLVDRAPYATHALSLFSAHVMGGAPLGDDPARSVVRSEDLRHHRVEDLFVCDGSLFPTSLGVNPQESIYGLAHLFASRWRAAWPRG